MNILVTGGAGYIGSHTCLELLKIGYRIVVVDNLSNSSRESLRRVENLTGMNLEFCHVDLLDKESLESVFKKFKFHSVIHFAGLKAVGESVAIPLKYYQNNITGTLVLLELMEKYDVRNIVFSSSATVYGDPHTVPITEDFPLSATNPYGRTKLMIEEILNDVHAADKRWNVILLRYFNPVGAHESGEIGEDPQGIPNNLMPYISQVHVGKLKELSVFGNDYPTHDGTGVRDYIHVVDLALGHVKAVERISENSGLSVYNLGTGQGYSVLDMVKAYEKAAGSRVPFKFAARRPGDVAACYADPGKANRELGWKAERDVDTMCRDTLKWQTQNPQGFRTHEISDGEK